MVLKRALADRVVLAAAFFVVLFGATLVAAIPIYVNAVGQSGLRERLERAPVTEANLEATAPVSGGEEAALDSQVTKLTQAALAPVGGAPVYRSGESEPFNAAGRVVVFGFFDGIRDHASLVAGRWPRDGEVVVPAPAAAALRLHIGDTVDAQSRLAGGPHVSARVAGIYRVDRPSSAYWWEEPLATTGADAGELGPLVTTRRSFLSLGLQGAELRWRLEPSFHGLTTGQGEDLRRALQRLPGRLNQGRSCGRAGLGRDGAAGDPRRRGPLAPRRPRRRARPLDPGRAAGAVRAALHDRPAARAAPGRDREPPPARRQHRADRADGLRRGGADLDPGGDRRPVAGRRGVAHPQLGRAARGHRAAPRPEGHGVRLRARRRRRGGLHRRPDAARAARARRRDRA